MARYGVLAVWLVSGLFTLGMMALARELIREPPPPQPAPAGLSMPRREAAPWARWTVTEQLSAHHVLIVHIETDHLNEARSIARQVVEPIRERFAEVLVYVHRPGRPDAVAPRRIQWTRARGYVETQYP